MLIKILTFNFPKLFSFIFFGQIWSQNLKFFKFTEISYRDTLLYAYYNRDVYFFQSVCQSYFFEQILSQNLKFSKLTEIWCRGTLRHVYYDFNLYFFKSFVIDISFSKFGPKIWCCPKWLESTICVYY